MSYLGEVLALRRDFPAFRVMNGDLAKAGEALLLGAQGLITSYTKVDPAGGLDQGRAGRARPLRPALLRAYRGSGARSAGGFGRVSPVICVGAAAAGVSRRDPSGSGLAGEQTIRIGDSKAAVYRTSTSRRRRLAPST